MGQNLLLCAQLGAERSRQDESKEVGGVGLKRASSGGNGGACRSVDWADFSVVGGSSRCRATRVQQLPAAACSPPPQEEAAAQAPEPKAPPVPSYRAGPKCKAAATGRTAGNSSTALRNHKSTKNKL
jgi:hypothetical protein